MTLPRIRLFLIIFSLSFGITALILTLQAPKQANETSLSPYVNQPTQTPTPTPDPLAPKNVLILGYGGGNHDGGSLTDTIMIAHLRPKEEKVLLITIPRDLSVAIPVETEQTKEYKINHAYAIGVDNRNYPNKPEQYLGSDGGRRLAADVVSTVTGLPIDHVAAISFSGFLKALELLGPITVDVPQSFTDPYYPVAGKETESCGFGEEDIRNLTATMSGFDLEKQFPCRYETLSFTKGVQQMKAEDALKFVRSRHAGVGGGDFNRSKRQAAVITGVKQKVFSAEILPKVIPLGTTLLQSVDTDVTISDLPELLGLYRNASSYSISSVSLSTDNVLAEGIGQFGQYQLTAKPGVTIQDFVQTAIASVSATR